MELALSRCGAGLVGAPIGVDGDLNGGGRWIALAAGGSVNAELPVMPSNGLTSRVGLVLVPLDSRCLASSVVRGRVGGGRSLPTLLPRDE